MGLIAKIEEKLSSNNRTSEPSYQEGSSTHTTDSANAPHTSAGRLDDNTAHGTAHSSSATHGLSGQGSSHTDAHSSNVSDLHAVRGDTTRVNDFASTHSAPSAGHNDLTGSEASPLSSGVGIAHKTGSNNTSASHGLPGSDSHNASHGSNHTHSTQTQSENVMKKSGGPHPDKENYDAIPEAGGLKVGSGPFEHDRSYEPGTSSGHSHGHSHNHTGSGSSTVQSHGEPAHSAGKHGLDHEQSHTKVGHSHDQLHSAMSNSHSHNLGNPVSSSVVEQPLQHSSTSHMDENGGVQSAQNVPGTAGSTSTPTDYSQSMAQHQANQMMR